MSKYENEYRYIQFPISLMQGLFEDKKTALNNILCYGVYKFSKEFEFNLDDVVRQIIYMYYKNTLGEKIMDMISDRQ